MIVADFRFNTKVEKFLYFLLEKSQITDKQIQFPIPYNGTIQLAAPPSLLL